jgi:hypothetical protein
VSNTSKYTFGPPTVVDFTSIQSGAIQGRVDVSVTSGSVIGFDPSNTSFDLLLQAQGCCSAGGDIRALVVSSAVILTPEVSTFFMLGSGLLWISLARRLVEL